jgi:hypothetical protein
LLIRLYWQKGRTPTFVEREIAGASLRSGEEAIGG